MSEWAEAAVRVMFIGVGATAVMDLWAVVRRRVFRGGSLDLAMLGRWIGHWPRGRFVHKDIKEAAPVRGERAIGWAAHYAIGVSFAVLLVAVWGLEWARRPTLWPALVVGLVTVVAPFFVLQPGMGAGIAASRTPNPTAARLGSLASHTAYGVGLYVAAVIGALLVRS